MKQIPLLQVKALLIELPEGANSAQDSHANGFIYKLPDGYVESWYADEDGGLDGNWRIIGMLSEVTESEAAELVETVGYIGHDTDTWPVFKDYNDNQDGFLYALESLESAIEAVGYYLDNNLIPPFHERKDDWMMAREHVLDRLDRSRCLLLGRRQKESLRGLK